MPESEAHQFDLSRTAELEYFDVTNEGIFAKTNPERDRVEFWDRIFENNKEVWNTNFSFYAV